VEGIDVSAGVDGRGVEVGEIDVSAGVGDRDVEVEEIVVGSAGVTGALHPTKIVRTNPIPIAH
jgi:hypothetical protein